MRWIITLGDLAATTAAFLRYGLRFARLLLRDAHGLAATTRPVSIGPDATTFFDRPVAPFDFDPRRINPYARTPWAIATMVPPARTANVKATAFIIVVSPCSTVGQRRVRRCVRPTTEAQAVPDLRASYWDAKHAPSDAAFQLHPPFRGSFRIRDLVSADVDRAPRTRSLLNDVCGAACWR